MQRLLVFFVATMICRVSSECDVSTNAMVQEGNIGQSEKFSWLGVLRVHVHHIAKEPQIALTGLVLIRMRYALVSADDIARISPRVFKEDTKAMFMAGLDTPWFCPTRSYVTHPEYQYKTMNSIGLVELNLDEVLDYPMRPACFTNQLAINTSTYLYITGYTDENKLLEKVIYKMQYTDKKICEDFYNRSGLADPKTKPVHYLCGFSKSKPKQCIWDNGMAVVTNATQLFALIGLVIRGPGCAAPARFIDLQYYYDWIDQSSSSQQQIYDDYLH